MTLRPRAVVVYRRTELDELLDRHSTRGQAEFFLRTRGRSLAEVQAHHDAATDARRTVVAALPSTWAVAQVERDDLSRFLFAPEDLVLVVGQDGLVANTAKYVSGQLVVGVDPEPGINPGVLVRHDAAGAVRLLAKLGPNASGRIRTFSLTMAEAELDDGQRLRALNEIYVGHHSHQSARYVIHAAGHDARQSSSGIIVGTGTGATGWCASIARDRGGRTLPKPTDALLTWFVREAWPSPATDVQLTEGLLGPADRLVLTASSDQLVVFGDGIETDRLDLSWGQDATVHIAPDRLRLAA